MYKRQTWESLQDIDAHRRIIFEAIVKYRKMKNQGVVAVLDVYKRQKYNNLCRLLEKYYGNFSLFRNIIVTLRCF